jgi:hypothetical protein
VCKIEGCGLTVLATALCCRHYHQAYRVANLEKRRAWAKANRKKINRKNRAYWKANRDKKKTLCRQWASANAEHLSVRGHYHLIFTTRSPYYVDMPYWDEWNPNRGGSFKAGAKWIIENIGRRPGTSKEYQLHIISRRLGFVPGNLAWIPRDKHRQDELIPKLLIEIQNLRLELDALRRPQ